MYRPISQQVQDTVAKLFLEDMRQQFPDGFVFGPVEVKGDEFRDGEPCLRVTIVYEGDLTQLDPIKMLGQPRRVIPKLVDAGIEEFPVTDFSEKSAWESRKQGRKKVAGG